MCSPYLTHYCELPMTSSHSKSSLTFLLWLSLLEMDLQKEIFYSALMFVVATGIFCTIFHTGFTIHFVCTLINSDIHIVFIIGL